jgi:RND family efflux transporter MFP subunit
MKSQAEEPETRSKAFWIWVVAGGLVVFVAILAWMTRARDLHVAAVRAARQDLEATVLSDGTLEPPPGGILRASEPSIVGSILATEGAPVSRGEPLVRLESPELSAQASRARAQFLELSAERERVTADFEDSSREEIRRRKLFEGDARLLAAGAISKSDFENDESALKQARGRTASLRASLDSLATGPSSRLALARKLSEDLDRRCDALLVRAPSAGVAYGLPRTPGEAVEAGQAVANVADPARRRLRARIDQPDIPRIAAGQRILVTFDGLPDSKWNGRVESVSTGLREVAGREVGEVIGEITSDTRALPPNAAVNVQIVVGEKPKALVIPRAALFRDGANRFVYRFENGRAKKTPVETGLIGERDVEIVGGLSEGVPVILPGSAPLSDGLKVAARPE